MSDKPEGIGRGGRGALLLAALGNKPRRPGEGSKESTEQSSEQRPLGRGAFLQSILSQGRGRATPVVQQQTEPPPIRFVGRGRGLTLSSLGETSSRAAPSIDVPKQQISPEPAVKPASPVQQAPREIVKPSTSPSSLESKVEELSIGTFDKKLH